MEMSVLNAAPEKASLEHLDRGAWESLCTGFSDLNYQQTWAYGTALAQRRGAVSEHVAIRAGGETIALADIRVKRLPFVGGGIAYISSGPLTRRDSCDRSHALKLALEALNTEYVHRQGLVLRILPPIGDAQENEQAARAFAVAGFLPTDRVRGYRTFLLDITPEPGMLRSALAQKWRNCLNASERQNLSVETGSSDKLFEQFTELLDGLVARKGFGMDLGARFYADLQRELAPREKMVVTLVRGDGQLHAGGVFAMHGDTCVYLLGATAEAGMRSKASYLLHWQVLLLARERGIRRYDLGGIDPVGNPGVYNFKKGVSGQDVSAAGPFERTASGLRQGITRTAESLYRAVQQRARRKQAAIGA